MHDVARGVPDRPASVARLGADERRKRVDLHKRCCVDREGVPIDIVGRQQRSSSDRSESERHRGIRMTIKVNVVVDRGVASFPFAFDNQSVLPTHR